MVDFAKDFSDGLKSSMVINDYIALLFLEKIYTILGTIPTTEELNGMKEVLSKCVNIPNDAQKTTIDIVDAMIDFAKALEKLEKNCVLGENYGMA